MFPETLVTLICTLEKSWSCAEVVWLSNIASTPTAKSFASRIIKASRIMPFMFPPQSGAADSITASAKLELRNGINASQVVSDAPTVLQQPIGRDTQRARRHDRCSRQGRLRFRCADAAGRSGA